MVVMAACSMPIGSIYGAGNNNRSPDSIFLIPRRQIYPIDERFLRDVDFQMFIVDRGSITEILPPFTQAREVFIQISGNEGLSTEFREDVLTTHHEFIRIGRHIINVTYREKSSFYSVEVTSSNNGTGLGGDGGIGIIWLGDDKSQQPPPPPPEPEPDPEPEPEPEP
jgi:hypothetical protein